METDAEAVQYVFRLPRGIDTSFPLKFEFLSSVVVTGVGAVTLIGSLIPLEASGVLTADPAGGVTPVARTLANTELLTAKTADTVTSTALDGTVADKMQSIQFEDGFDISDYYEGDAVLVRIELDVSQGADIIAWQLVLEGVAWTGGEKIQR